MRVAVIGAGAAGLCAVKQLLEHAHPKGLQPVGFEQGQSVGGTWNYTDDTGTDANGLPIHSSMYKNLNTNIPKEVMAFPGFPFNSALPSFVSHSDVAEYLRLYADHHDLNRHIKFNTTVHMLAPISGSGDTKWKVVHSPSDKQEQKSQDEFNAVIICNGHYSVPLFPVIKGMDIFKGTILHSHHYRIPEAFKNKRVVVLGAGASGQDIAVDLCTQVKRVFLSSNKLPVVCRLPDNLFQVPGITRMKETSVVFEDDREEDVDVLLLCTGYKYEFRFLDNTIGIDVDSNQRVTPLYKHIFCIKFPSLSFIGLCKTICPFPHFHVQIRTVVAILNGEAYLPSCSEMIKDAEDDFAARLARGLPRRYAHLMATKQWDYLSELVHLGKFKECIPDVVKALYNHIHVIRASDLLDYKNSQCKIVDSNSFLVTK